MSVTSSRFCLIATPMRQGVTKWLALFAITVSNFVGLNATIGFTLSQEIKNAEQQR